MKHIILALITTLFVSCSVMVSDFSGIVKETDNLKTNPITEIKDENNKSEIIQKEEEVIIEETPIIKEPEIVIEEKTIEEESIKEEETEEPSEIKEVIEEKTIEEEKTETIEEPIPIIEEEKTIEEVIIEEDNLKISKIDNTYTIEDNDTVITFTKEDVLKNNRYLYIPEQNCIIYEAFGEFTYTNYSTNTSYIIKD